jgi:hypothetical protein
MVFAIAPAGITTRWPEKLPWIFAGRNGSAEKVLLCSATFAGGAVGRSGKGVPPMRFAELLAGSELDAPLRAEIDALLEIKQRAGEAEYGPNGPFHAFCKVSW